jgi:hypothetical protein
VLLRAVATGVAIGIPAFVLSAGNGLRAADVIAWSHRSMAARGLLWAGWLVLSAPALRTAFIAPGSLILRSLRVRRGLYTLHLLRLLRAERARGCAALAAVIAGTLGVQLSLRNDPSERSLHRALIVMALPLAVAAALCVAPLLENERRMRALLRSLRIRQSVVLGAFLLAVSTPSSALAAASGVVAGMNAGLAPLPLSAALVGWAIALACAVACGGRLLERRHGRNAGLFVAGVTLIAVLATAGANTW